MTRKIQDYTRTVELVEASKWDLLAPTLRPWLNTSNELLNDFFSCVFHV
jgi:hypothetical protein